MLLTTIFSFPHKDFNLQTFVVLAIFVHPFPNKPLFFCVCKPVLLKTLWKKREIARNKQSLLFPQCFLPFCRIFSHFHQIQSCRLQTLLVWKSLEFVIWERVNWRLGCFQLGTDFVIL